MAINVKSHLEQIAALPRAATAGIKATINAFLFPPVILDGPVDSRWKCAFAAIAAIGGGVEAMKNELARKQPTQ